MGRFILRILIAAAGLWLSAQVIPGVAFDGWFTLIIAGFLLGVVNAVVRPVVIFLTFPLTVATLGLFLFVVNAMMIGLVDWFLKGLHVGGLMACMLAAIITGVVSWGGQVLLGDAKKDRD